MTLYFFELYSKNGFQYDYFLISKMNFYFCKYKLFKKNEVNNQKSIDFIRNALDFATRLAKSVHSND